MALMMNLYCNGRDDDFYIGDTRVKVVSVYNPLDFTVCVYHADGSESLHKIGRTETEIYPSVGAFAHPDGSGTRVVIGVCAPRDLTILRGKLYRASGEERHNPKV